MEQKQEIYVISALISQTHNTTTCLDNANVNPILLKLAGIVCQKVQMSGMMIPKNVLSGLISIIITECVLLAPVDAYHAKTVIHVRFAPQDSFITQLQVIALSYAGTAWNSFMNVTMETIEMEMVAQGIARFNQVTNVREDLQIKPINASFKYLKECQLNRLGKSEKAQVLSSTLE